MRKRQKKGGIKGSGDTMGAKGRWNLRLRKERERTEKWEGYSGQKKPGTEPGEKKQELSLARVKGACELF